jgi:membrane fusion protein (multidrug efflux system)
MNDSPTPAAAPAAPANGNPKRKKALTAVAAAVVVGGAAYGLYYWLVLSHYESTDNAYVQANVVQITPQVPGTVLAIEADDTDFVKAGQPLVKLDPADARVALDQAEAQLAQTVREVRTLYTGNSALKAQVALHEAEAARAEADLKRAQEDVARRAPLVATGAVGKEEFNHANTQLAAARSALAAAQAAVQAAKDQLASNETMIADTSVEQQPNVQRGAAQVREAFLALRRDTLPAPVNGYVAKRSVQVGQRVQPGTPLMTVVALNNVWVDANFKESQLRNLRIGQPATLEADVYGKKVTYHGKIEGLSAGTGAAFSLLPAQNATGNWIKVVQRVPVRVALDEQEVQQHPLRVGLSMNVKVDISHTDGRMLADMPPSHPVAKTDVYDQFDELADAEVRKVIDANLGRSHLAAAPSRRAAATPHAAPARQARPGLKLASAAAASNAKAAK